MNKRPYLSFVVVGRNDNYGYKFKERFQNFLDNLVYLCEKYKLNSEIIIVEWNPPKENKKLYEELRINKKRKCLQIRFIEVPKKIHDNFENSSKIALFEYPGKNIGIRKAKGDFVLITNPDILFNEEIIHFFSEGKLKENSYYRIKKYNLSDVPSIYSSNKFSDYCKNNWEYREDKYLTTRNLSKKRIFLKKIPLMVLGFVRRILLRIFSKKYRIRMSAEGFVGPGDFTLMSKENWIKLKGYPEIKIKHFLDSAVCINAKTKGIQKVELKDPLRIYHQFHYQTKKIKTQQQQKFEGELFKKIIKGIKIDYNDSNWGLDKIKLNEIVK